MQSELDYIDFLEFWALHFYGRGNVPLLWLGYHILGPSYVPVQQVKDSNLEFPQYDYNNDSVWLKMI